MAKYEATIIGGGPAGLAAGLYTSSADLKSCLIERGTPATGDGATAAISAFKYLQERS